MKRPRGSSYSISRRDFMRAVGAALAALGSAGVLEFLPGCGGGGSGGGGVGNNGGAATSVSGAVNQQQLGANPLTVSTAQGSATTGTSGGFTVPVSPSASQLLAATDSSGAAHALAVSVPGSGPLSVDATSTATALLFLTPGIFTNVPSEAATRIQQIQGLPSFPALESYLQQNIGSSPLGALAQATLGTYVSACVGDWQTAYASAARADNTSAGGATFAMQSNGSVEISNLYWRYIAVFRFDDDPSGNSVAGPVRTLVPGATAATWGSLFSRNPTSAPGTAYDNPGLSSSSGVSTLDYWVNGLGFASSQTPPASLQSDIPDTAAYGYTIALYILVPIISAFFAIPMGKAAAVAGKIWDAIEPVVSAEVSSLASGSFTLAELESTLAEIVIAVLSDESVLSSVLSALGETASRYLIAILAVAAAAVTAANLGLAAISLFTLPAVSEAKVSVLGATATVTGTLVDIATGAALSGYAISVWNEGVSGVSDSNGNFSIANVPLGPATLIFTDPDGVQDGSYTISQVTGSTYNAGTIQIEGSPPVTPPLVRRRR